MRELLEQYWQQLKRKRFKTAELERFVRESMGQAYGKQGGYASFAQAVEQAVKEGRLKPVRSSRHNGMNPPLYNAYHVVQAEKTVQAHLLVRYHPKLRMSAYARCPDEYARDEPYLQQLDRFFREGGARAPVVSANERSFALFGDEKWLTSDEGQRVLRRVGLTLADLRCEVTYEPFFYYQRQLAEGDPHNVLIVENKDTFFSFKTLFQEGVYRWADVPFALLIYGEGRKIERSFSFVWELGLPVSQTQFYYFGDLDPEGVAIWYRLSRKGQQGAYPERVVIRPFSFFYEQLVNQWADRAPRQRHAQRGDREAVDAFLRHLSPAAAARIRVLFSEGRYLPQEGLNRHILRLLAEEGKGEDAP